MTVIHVAIDRSIVGRLRFDLADAALLAGRTWRSTPDGYAAAGYYEARDPSKPIGHANRVHRIIRMHRLLLNAPVGIEVDHINGDRLDNRRSNLRLVTSSQNKMNAAIRSDNRTGHKGVFYEEDRHRWMAYIKSNGKRIQLGRYPTKQQAIIARQAAEKVAHGKYRRTA